MVWRSDRRGTALPLPHLAALLAERLDDGSFARDDHGAGGNCRWAHVLPLRSWKLGVAGSRDAELGAAARRRASPYVRAVSVARVTTEATRSAHAVPVCVRRYNTTYLARTTGGRTALMQVSFGSFCSLHEPGQVTWCVGQRFSSQYFCSRRRVAIRGRSSGHHRRSRRPEAVRLAQQGGRWRNRWRCLSGMRRARRCRASR
jgi:hypothetical protein